jgi:hypothetical protein
MMKWFTALYFQMVCGLPDEVGGQREQWIGIFVHGDFFRKDRCSFVIHLRMMI